MAQADNKEGKKPSRVKAVAKFMFDIPTWVGSDFIMDSTHWLIDRIKRVFFSSRWGEGVFHETFEEATHRLNLSEQDLVKQQKNFYQASFLFLGLAILTIFYFAFLWHRSSWLVLLVTLIVFVLFLLQAYFYSYWCFQIKRRRLGNTFRDWFNWMLRGRL